MRRIQQYVVAMCLSVLAIGSHAWANDLADMWVITPKEGKRTEFEKAFKQHVAFREKQNDPRSWQVFTPAVGADLDHYIVRACCFSWADMDSYRDWAGNAKTGEHWQTNVNQLVGKVSHYLSELDAENSHWPEDAPDYRYFEVVSLYPKQGHGSEIGKDMKAISDAAKAMEWDEHWAWRWTIGGPTELTLVFPYTNWADMKQPEPSFAERLAKQMDSEDEAKALMQRWSKHFKHSESTIYRHNAEMSMKPTK
ncbi:hypothetical protein [Ferrimonas lipolytica]|uniref:NIPSNAP protein n=1 Tax=Ferrimonas lipolytica TaxID=2724191 RepID=A0A6H1UCD1_9GAMM|nr:hypothetical protein [Ferrimonas lipolytica]QIZ76757.1 hypothetical protein HER31_07650 [Ferrimonas lipolytica]